jgi:hypothetical protein
MPVWLFSDRMPRGKLQFGHFSAFGAGIEPAAPHSPTARPSLMKPTPLTAPAATGGNENPKSEGPAQTGQPNEFDGDWSGLHDFDYMAGAWHVRHRRTDPGVQDWNEFDGTSRTCPTMGGAGNVEDNVIELPAGSYRAVAIRAYDSKTGLWAIWWVDGRHPHGKLDPPVTGRFEGGVGRFYADDIIGGKPVRIRFTWTYAAPDAARWEQAFSEDAGKTWDTNWIMDFSRVR